MTSVGLAAFRKSLASKVLDSSKLQIRSGPHIPVALSTQLVNSVFGIEGMNIFPTLFTETGDKFKVSSSVATQIQSTIALTRQAERSAQDFSSMLADIGLIIRSDMSKLQQASSSAGWKMNVNDWIEISTTAESSLYSSTIFASREPGSLFNGAKVAPITNEEIKALSANAPFRCFKGGGIDFFSTAILSTSQPRYLALGILDASHVIDQGHKLEQLDSRGILFAATSLVNQAVAYERDEPQTGYCVSTDGKRLRFQAFQLNTLNFDAGDQQMDSRRNASWVYETELYHESTSNPAMPLVNPEAIDILSSILLK